LVITPPPLKKGDVVRVIAPASPHDAEPFERGLAVLRDRLGLEPRMRADITSRERYLAGSDARRAEEWAEAVADSEARAIWCARGGYGAMRILPSIDPKPLLAAPRWVIGFSDITVFHSVLNKAGLVTAHAPVIIQVGKLAEEALEALEALITGRSKGIDGTGVIRPGKARGRLSGGTLALLAHLCGTPYFPDLAGAVLFLEDVGEKPYRLDRYLTQLQLAGAFRKVAGVCVGHITDCDEPGTAGAQVVREFVEKLGVPAIEGIPAGHEPRNCAMAMGAEVELHAPGPGEPGRPGLTYVKTGARA
jgi:muramoyltetrapeptide carboxypeptidase